MSDEVDTEIDALLRTVQILHVEDDDTLVLTHPGMLSEAASNRLKTNVEDTLNGKVRVLILEEGMKLSLVRGTLHWHRAFERGYITLREAVNGARRDMDLPPLEADVEPSLEAFQETDAS